jgi:splicing factor 3B subunit 1
MRAIRAFVDSVGKRLSTSLQASVDEIAAGLNRPNHRTRQHCLELLTIYSSSLYDCGMKKDLLYFYGQVQAFLGEEYPDVLASVLDAIRSITDIIEAGELNPPPEEIVGHLVPILKNRHNKVSYSCISLIMSMSIKSPESMHNKEWMRICFELLELLKADRKRVRSAAVNAFAYIAKAIGPFDVLLALLNNLQVQERQIRLCTTSAIAVLAERCGAFNVLPALMNEYRAQDANVQNGTLKAIQFLFQAIGRRTADYAYSVTPLLTGALIEREAIHRQIACGVVEKFALGCFASGKEDALIHLLNHLLPNIFESTLHFIDAVMDALDALRVSLGPGICLQYCLAGLFHPARKVRSQYWRVYNNLVIYSGDALVPYYPLLQNTSSNRYHRDEFDVFI